MSRPTRLTKDETDILGVSFTPASHICWHFPLPARCIQAHGMNITDRNNHEVIAHFYTATICPVCLKRHGEVMKSDKYCQKESVISNIQRGSNAHAY